MLKATGPVWEMDLKECGGRERKREGKIQGRSALREKNKTFLATPSAYPRRGKAREKDGGKNGGKGVWFVLLLLPVIVSRASDDEPTTQN